MTLKQTSLNSGYSSSSSLETSIRDLFSNYNIHIHAEGVNEVNIYCPFHKNMNSPAFYINMKTGLWQCFNPTCGEKGNFRKLYQKITGKPFGKDLKLDHVSLSNELERSLKYGEEAKKYLDISDIEIDYDSHKELNTLLPFIERGLLVDTLRYFEIGFSDKKNRIVIPVRDVHFNVVGFIGRAIDDSQEPRYLYNQGFKRADVLFNIQNAKRYDSCIVVEGSVDAMFIHQAGYPNVVATLGSKVSANQFSMLRKYFDEIIVFSDNDDAGEQMKCDILDACIGKELYTVVYPEHKKDPGEMTESEIKNSIQNKILHI
jgi:DNA primase